MTKLRSAILAMLKDAGRPMSALDLASSAKGLCDTATIYRSLHFLESKGFAESFVLSCSAHGTERYYAAGGTCHRHWFHCESCHEFVDMGACTLDSMLAEMGKASGVRIKSHTLYATGICAACEASAACGSRSPSAPPSFCS
jgi:Fur family ferric uptake transcriptional regulator